MRNPPFSRREFFLLAGTAACVKAVEKDFWNSKPPSQWDRGEIYTLMNSSPWAKTVSWQGPRTSKEHGLRGGQVGGMPEFGPKAVITWESAPPVRDAMKTPSAPVYANYYVVGVDTVPNADDYDDLQKYASLRCAGRSNFSVSAFAVRQLVRTSVVCEFAFSRAAAPIGLDTGEVIFDIDLGDWTIESRFKPKVMLYRGQLAL
jgi:hypothetical protein